MYYSKQRETILNVLRNTTSHPNAQWVYENVKKVIPNISLATVYRNLNLLAQSGEIMRLQGDFAEDRFDGNAANHAHFVCKSCGRVLDTDIEGELKLKILASVPMKADDFSLIFTGVCDDCRLKNKN